MLPDREICWRGGPCGISVAKAQAEGTVETVQSKIIGKAPVYRDVGSKFSVA